VADGGARAAGESLAYWLPTSWYLGTSWDAALFAAFSNQLSTLGYVEGKNLIIDKREAEGKNDRLPALADLVALHPNAIVAVATPAIAAARRATAAIPIIMTPATDPVRSGFAKSLAHPGENLTGLAFMGEDLVSKSLEVLHTIVPGAKKIAVLMSSNPTHPPLYYLVSDAAGRIGLSTVAVVAPAASDLDRAFRDIANANATPSLWCRT
jgi:ABC-type uncharacterized transport system substrate-binding protein